MHTMSKESTIHMRRQTCTDYVQQEEDTCQHMCLRARRHSQLLDFGPDLES